MAAKKNILLPQVIAAAAAVIVLIIIIAVSSAGNTARFAAAKQAQQSPETCGNLVCDKDAGETFESCPRDCLPSAGASGAAPVG